MREFEKMKHSSLLDALTVPWVLSIGTLVTSKEDTAPKIGPLFGQVIQRWTSTSTNARLEGLNSLLQVARNLVRSYRNNETFVAKIYIIASPAGSILKIYLKRRRTKS